MNRFFYIFIFLFFSFIFFSQINISSSKIGGINNSQKGYYLVDSARNGNVRKIGEREILIISKKMAKEQKADDLLRLVRKTKFGTQKSRFAMVLGMTVFSLGGLYCIESLMQYPNAYKTQAESDAIKKGGLIIGANAFTLGLGFETLAILQYRKKKKNLLKTANLYNSYLK